MQIKQNTPINLLLLTRKKGTASVYRSLPAKNISSIFFRYFSACLWTHFFRPPPYHCTLNPPPIYYVVPNTYHISFPSTTDGLTITHFLFCRSKQLAQSFLCFSGKSGWFLSCGKVHFFSISVAGIKIFFGV